MKKIAYILLGALLLFFACDNAEGQAVIADKSLGYEQTWFVYPGITSDTIGTADSTWTFDVTKRTNEKINAGFKLDVDSTGGTGAALTIYLQKKATDTQIFENTDTFTISTGVDSSLYMETSTSHLADYWRVFVQCENDEYKAKFTLLEGKFGGN